MQFADSSTAVLGVPLKWHDDVTGVLFIADKVGRQFTPEDAHFLALFADHAAIALASAAWVQQLHDQQALFQRLVQSSLPAMSRPTRSLATPPPPCYLSLLTSCMPTQTTPGG